MKRVWIVFIPLAVLWTLIYLIVFINNTDAYQQENTVNLNWSTRTLDQVDWGYHTHHSNVSITAGSANKSHISYRGPNDNLQYATNQTGCWVTEAVYDVSVPVARENAIALDSTGQPHISFSYRDGNAEDLKYAHIVNGQWQVVTVDASNSAGIDNDIAIDNNDGIHISHWEWYDDEVRYSTNISGTWLTEVITDANWNKTSIGLDSNNGVHIAFKSYSQIKYTNNVSGAWHIEAIGVGSHPAIAIDSNDKIHIIFSGSGDLKYATNVSGTWLVETIDSGVYPWRGQDIAIDTNNNAHVGYYDSNRDILNYGHGSNEGKKSPKFLYSVCRPI